MRDVFPAGKPVKDDCFVGRKELLSELNSILGIGQSVVLIAPRRYGKTSVALELLRNLRKSGYFVAEIDMFDVTDKRHLAGKIIESCLKNNPVPIDKYWQKLKNGTLSVLSMLKFKPSDEEMEMVLQLGMPSVDEDKLLDNALDFPEKFCLRHKKKMIMFMDELQEVIKIGGDQLLKKMRAKFQRHQSVTYLFAGSQESLMTELFQFKQHAFYRFGRLFEIGNIARKDFAPYISSAFAREEIKIDSGYMDIILDITAGHPYYTQLLCQMMYIGCLKRQKRNIDKTDIIVAEDNVVEHEQALFDEVWKEIGEKKYSRHIISLIAQGLSPYSYKSTSKENIARILADLARYGYISKTGSGKGIKYNLKDPFFKKYILLKLSD